MKIPALGPNVPGRGNALSHALGRASYAITGWHFVGELPNLPKFVLIIAPHTSNWDFFVGLGALFSLGIKLAFFGKDSIFTWPLGPVMRWLGGIPIDRSVSQDRVAESVAAFKSRDKLVLGVAPEGTRKRVEEWKTGFYHVARGAGVPIVPVGFDYAKKAIVIGEPFTPTGDVGGDIQKLKAFFADVTAKRPENYVR